MDVPFDQAVRSERQNVKERYLFFVFCLIVPLASVIMYAAGKMPAKYGAFADSDCYMHLIRAQKLWDTGRWYDPISERSNAPYGEELHWTRPFDVLLLAGAAPAALVRDFPSALFGWAVIISPVLFAATLLLLPWATRPLLSHDGALLTSLFLVVQLHVFMAFQPGRPDHHSLLTFLFVLSLGCVLRLVLNPYHARWCYGAAVVSAFSIWTSIESTLMTGTLLAALGLLWVVRGDDFLKKLFHYSLGLFVFTWVALLIERPPHNLGAREFDRLSIIHGTALGALALLCGIAFVLAGRTRLFTRSTGRLLGSFLGLAALLLLMVVVFPGASRGPLADVNAEVSRVYVRNVAEMQPLLSEDYRLILAVPLLGGVIICLPMLLWRSLRGPSRAAWIYVSLSLAVFLLVTFLQRRWMGYVAVLLVLPCLEIVTAAWARLDRQPLSFKRSLQKALVLVPFAYFLALSGALADAAFNKSNATKHSGDAAIRPICEYLSQTPPWQTRRFRILTHLFWGGEILYRTPHEVVATPYHRNTRGILDAYTVLTADTDDKALEVVRQRQVDLILLCPESDEGRFCYGEKSATFGRRLCNGEIPDWCRRVDLPAELSGFQLFQVRSD